MYFNTRSIKIRFVIAQVFLTLCLASCGNEPDSTVVMNGYKHRVSEYNALGRQISIYDNESIKAMYANLEGIEQPASFNVINTYSREKNGETLFVYKCSMGYISKNPAAAKYFESDGGTISPILTFAMVKRGKEWFVVDAPN